MKIKLQGLMNKAKDVKPTVKVMRNVSKLTYALLDAQDLDETIDEREQMRVAMVAMEQAVDFLAEVFDIPTEKLDELEQQELFDKVNYAMARLQGASDAELKLLKAQEAQAAKQAAADPLATPLLSDASD